MRGNEMSNRGLRLQFLHLKTVPLFGAVGTRAGGEWRKNFLQEGYEFGGEFGNGFIYIHVVTLPILCEDCYM